MPREISNEPRASCRPTQNVLVKRVSRSETSTSGNPMSRITEDTKFRAAVSAVVILNVGTSHTCPVKKMMCTCKKNVSGLGEASCRKFHEVETDAAAAARRHGNMVEQAGGRQMVGFDVGRQGRIGLTPRRWPTGQTTIQGTNASALSRPK